MHIYCDLDGVLTDFDKQIKELLGYHPPKEFNDPKIWKKIDKAGEKFWSEMSWLENGHALWGAIKKYDPTILTAPSNHPSSESVRKYGLNVSYLM